MAEALTRTFGVPSACVAWRVIAATQCSVDWTRLSCRRALNCGVQLSLKTPSPARLMIASHSAARSCQGPGSVGSPCTKSAGWPMICGPAGLRDRKTTSCFFSSSRRTSRLPISPVAPVTKTRMRGPPVETCSLQYQSRNAGASITGADMSLIPNRFLFRLAYPCGHVTQIPDDEVELLLALQEE